MTNFAARVITACAAVVIAVTPVAADAKAAARLSDLVGAKAAGGETDLQNRGFVMTGGGKSSSAAYSFWWDEDGEACVMVTTRDGRFASIADKTPQDCNHGGSSYQPGYRNGGESGGSGSNQYQRDNSGPPPHVTVHKNGTFSATLPGCLANFDRNGRKTSAFSSCKPDDLRRMSEAVNATMHEQGMGDDANQGERNGGGYNGGGNSAPVDVSDLVGDKAAGVETDLQARGFRNVDGFQSGGKGKGTIWWNGRTRQCLQMITVDGRADSITDIQTSPKCR